jgi:predicted pyridoxine 5'-phosphate oxidase superfamily flavin-nucleotide-binding protein
MGSDSMDAFVPDVLGPREEAFIVQRESVYMATVSESGWPYLQHRGGPRGFLCVLDPRTLAFADLRGNRQYLSTGNVMATGRVALFLMDYTNRARLKVLATAEVLSPEADAALTETVSARAARGRVERIFRLRVMAYDWNCPQHIPALYTEDDLRLAARLAREVRSEGPIPGPRRGRPPRP